MVDSPDTLYFKAGLFRLTEFIPELLRDGFEYTGKVADSHRFTNHLAETIKYSKMF